MTPSHNSPKNLYRAELSWNFAEETNKANHWTVRSYGAMTTEAIDKWAAALVAELRQSRPERSCYLKVQHNNAIWPAFDWQIVKEVDL